MEGKFNENDDVSNNNKINVETNVDNYNTMITTSNEEISIIIDNETNSSTKSQRVVLENNMEIHEEPSKIVQKPKSRDDKVFKCCPDEFCDVVERHIAHNEQLSERENELRQRLATLECWIPAITLIKMLTGEVDSSNIYHLIDEQVMAMSTSTNFHPHATLSQHKDSRIRDIEAERKKAHERLEEARKLLREKQSAVDERAKQIEEAEREHMNLEIKIGQLQEELKHDGIDVSKVTSNESIISLGPDDLACIIKLEELVADEARIKRQLEELERREMAYMNVFKTAENIIPKNKSNYEIDELRGQLEIKSVANQQMADRICLLEDQVENLKGRLARCKNHVDELTATNNVKTPIVENKEMKMNEIEEDKAIMIELNRVDVAAGSDHDSVKRKNRGIVATIRTDSKETLTRVELTDRCVQDIMANNRKCDENNRDESIFHDSLNKLKMPPIHENNISMNENINYNTKLVQSHDTTFKSLPSKIDDHSTWSTFSEIKDSAISNEMKNPNLKQDENSFVSLKSTIVYSSEENSVNPVSKNNVDHESMGQNQSGEIGVGTSVGSDNVREREKFHYHDDPKFVSLVSNISDSPWSTFSNIHESVQSTDDKPPLPKDNSEFVSLASTVHDDNSREIEGATSQPSQKIVPDGRVCIEIQTEKIELTQMELKMWLNNINDIRRHISRCPICKTKKRALILMCKAICHYLRIQFNVCTEDDENDGTRVTTAKEGDIYTIQGGILKPIIGKKIPLGQWQMEQLLPNQMENFHSTRNESMIENAEKSGEIPSFDGSIGLPIGMSTRIRENDSQSLPKKIDRGHDILEQQADFIPSNCVIDKSVDKSTSTGEKRLGQQLRVTANFLSHDGVKGSTADKSTLNDGEKHLKQQRDLSPDLPIGTSTPKQKEASEYPSQTKSTQETFDSEVGVWISPLVDRAVGTSIDISITRRGEKHSWQQTEMASNENPKIMDSTIYQRPPSPNPIINLIPIGTSTLKQIKTSWKKVLTQESDNSDDKNSLMDKTAYMIIKTKECKHNISDEIRGEKSGGKKSYSVTSPKAILHRRIDEKSPEKSIDKKIHVLDELSVSEDEIIREAPSLRDNLSDSESQCDSRKSEDDDKRERRKKNKRKNTLRSIQLEHNKYFPRDNKKDNIVCRKNFKKNVYLSDVECSSSMYGQSTSYDQSNVEKLCCPCDTNRPFSRVTRKEYDRVMALDDIHRQRECLAELSSLNYPQRDVDTTNHKLKRRHRKNIKLMEIPSIQIQTNDQDRDVNRKHLPDFDCEVCDCEPCGTPSTAHSSSGRARVNPSANVPSRPMRSNRSVSAKIARTNR